MRLSDKIGSLVLERSSSLKAFQPIDGYEVKSAQGEEGGLAPALGPSDLQLGTNVPSTNYHQS